MPKAKLQAATVGGSVDEVEASFYEALQAGDVDKLMACWADEDDIVCVHPGGPRLVGTAAIRGSFEAVFDGDGRLAVQPGQVCKVESLTSVMHSLIEQISVQTHEGVQTVHVIVTNVYQRTMQGWRMVARHASPGGPVPAPADIIQPESPQVLH